MPGMRAERANTDVVLARLAARQHGVVSSRQLRTAGIDHRSISRRVQNGRLHRIHRGVYAVGHTNLSFEGRCMAAVLALGQCAVISHRSAAALWGLLPSPAGFVDVTVSGDGGRRKRVGVTVHRSFTLAPRVMTRRNGIGVTTPSRTLRDLHRAVPRQVYRRALRRALDLRLIRSDQLRDADLTRSELERRFVALCRRHRLPQPEVNARVGGYEVDFLWPDRHLIVETDGFRHHAGRSAFESDRARDVHLQSLGYRVLRFTHRQVEERTTVVEALCGLLSPAPLFT